MYGSPELRLVLAKRWPWLAVAQKICRRGRRNEFAGYSFPKMKSRAPKPGFWLMRGAQPATSAGARPFAGSPIPAFLIARKGR